MIVVLGLVFWACVFLGAAMLVQDAMAWWWRRPIRPRPQRPPFRVVPPLYDWARDIDGTDTDGRPQGGPAIGASGVQEEAPQ